MSYFTTQEVGNPMQMLNYQGFNPFLNINSILLEVYLL